MIEEYKKELDSMNYFLHEIRKYIPSSEMEIINYEFEHILNTKNGLIHFYDDDLDWLLQLEDEGETEKACYCIESEISKWYDLENYPEYESTCIGDVVEERLNNEGIDFKWCELTQYDDESEEE